MVFSTLLSVATMVAALPIPGFLLEEPLQDSFYDAPDNLSDLANGEVYDQRQVIPDLELQLSFSEVYQIAYKTTNTQGEDSHTITTVFKPLSPASEQRLFSYQIWEDSDELNCSPSYTLMKGLLAPDQITGVLDTAAAIAFGLSQGWYVTVPDHEGPRSAFIAGYEQGQAGLDGIRATENFLGFDQDTPVTLYGYSGGASASTWMANLHSTYAPELNIVGAAYGGTPIDIIATMDYLDRDDRAFSGFVIGACAGILHAYPEQNETVWPLLYPSFKDKLNQIDTPDNCILTEVLLDGWTEYHTQAYEPLLSNPTVLDVFHHESLLNNVSNGVVTYPTFPRYIFHADEDEIIPAGAVRQYVEQQCEKGADIQYVPWKGGSHIEIEYLGIPDAFQFLIQAFDGNTPQVKCGTPNNDVLTLASKTVSAVIGQPIVDIVNGVLNFAHDGYKVVFDPSTPYEEGQLP